MRRPGQVVAVVAAAAAERVVRSEVVKRRENHECACEATLQEEVPEYRGREGEIAEGVGKERGGGCRGSGLLHG